MRYVITLLLAAVAGGSVLRAAPQEALALALADIRQLDKDDQCFVRYLDLTHLNQEGRAFYVRVLTLHINMLSREAVLKTPRSVAAGQILAIDLRDYSIPVKVWERLLEREPYYHQIEEVTEYTTQQVPQYANDAYGRQIITGYAANRVAGKTVRKPVPARHLPRTQLDEFYTLSASQVPIVLGDWFFAMSSVEADRGGIGKGFGYYEFLEMRSRADYFKIIGFDEKDKRSTLSEIGAVVLGHNSGVAQNDRMVVRRAAIDGWAWFTLDFFDSNRDDHNPLAILDRDKGLKHQAERHFGRLPNGLPVVIACNDKGELQETAPDKIGPDRTANGQDTRIHCAKSCISCHSNGFLKDINDEVRVVYAVSDKGHNLLTSPVYDERLKLERIYLRDLRRYLDNDRRDYAIAVKECNGQEIKDASSDYRNAYERYVLRPVGVEDVAAGLGITSAVFKQKLVAYRTTDKLTTHILAPLSVGRPITRTNFEQLYPLLQQITRGIPQ